MPCGPCCTPQASTGLLMAGDTPSEAARRLLTRNRAPRCSQDRPSRSSTMRPEAPPPLHLMPTYTSRGSGDLQMQLNSHLMHYNNIHSAPLPAVSRQSSRPLALRS